MAEDKNTKSQAICNSCRIPGAAKRCGGCKITAYCSLKYQTVDWKIHQSKCAKADPMLYASPESKQNRLVLKAFRQSILDQPSTIPWLQTLVRKYDKEKKVLVLTCCIPLKSKIPSQDKFQKKVSYLVKGAMDASFEFKKAEIDTGENDDVFFCLKYISFDQAVQAQHVKDKANFSTHFYIIVKAKVKLTKSRSKSRSPGTKIVHQLVISYGKPS